ncbi:metalloregulator ArsR/SmtB family transcription factor [Aciditerrimonas ferrireducens]|nr:metalloregulator ArsR/SmtB family transcription factor [Aciditerrimonas ferrireducens]MCK4176760.1 metalloregulator ArsR/SmtB family transcription factor [Aciditerrimonas ferrireducens]
MGQDPMASRDRPTEEQVRAAVAAFGLLADRTRLLLLWFLASEELDVTTLAALVGARGPAVSQHLAKLRLAGLVEGRKVGRHVLYRAKGTHVRALVTEALHHADHQLQGIPDHP